MDHLHGSSSQSIGQRLQEPQVLLLGPGRDSERQWPRRLDDIIREDISELLKIEDFELIEVVQNYLHLW